MAQEVATALVHNSTLTSLSLEHCLIRDDGATHLATALARNTRLQSLFLEHKNIFRAGSLAIGHALNHSVCHIAWHTMIIMRDHPDEIDRPCFPDNGIYMQEWSPGKLWKELRLIASALNWTDLAVMFFRLVRSQQDQDTDRRLAFGMGLHPRLGSVSAARMLDHSLINYFHELAPSSLVAMHAKLQEKGDEHDSVARFYEAFDAALHADRVNSNGRSLQAWAISDVPATAADMWQQALAMATQNKIVATARTLRASCEQPVAVDLYEKLLFAFQRLGLVEKIKELGEAWHGDDAEGWHAGNADKHEYHSEFCKVCFQIEDDRDFPWGYSTGWDGSKHASTQSQPSQIESDEAMREDELRWYGAQNTCDP